MHDSSGAGAASGAGHELSRATLSLAARSAAALDRLLVKRIDGFESHRNQLLGLTLLSLLVAVYLISSFYLSNLRGFGALILRMRKLAQGDLTANFAARGRDEVSQLIGAFNASREQLLVAGAADQRGQRNTRCQRSADRRPRARS